MSFFSPDSHFYRFISRFWDLVQLNFLWMICCIPVFTVGPATVAAFSVCLKMSEDKEGYIAASFFKAFKENFKKGIPLGLIYLAVAYALYLNIQFIGVYSEDENLSLMFLISSVIVGYVLFMSAVYSFALMARYDNTVIQTIKNGGQISIRYFLRTMTLLFVLGIEVLVFMWNNILLIIGFFIGPATIIFTISGFAIYIFHQLEKEPGAVSNPEKLDED